MKRLLAIALLLTPSFVSAEPLSSDDKEMFFLIGMVNGTKAGNKPKLSSTLDTFGRVCEPIDELTQIQANILAEMASPNDMIEANSVIDTAIIKNGKEAWCATIKSSLIDVIKKSRN